MKQSRRSSSRPVTAMVSPTLRNFWALVLPKATASGTSAGVSPTSKMPVAAISRPWLARCNAMRRAPARPLVIGLSLSAVRAHWQRESSPEGPGLSSATSAYGWPEPSPSAWPSSTSHPSPLPRPLPAGGPLLGRAADRAVFHVGELERTGLPEGSAHGAEMPITDVISALLHEKVTLDQAAAALMQRPLKPER